MERILAMLVALGACSAARAADFIFFNGLEATTRPLAGSVVLTEIMSNPVAVADASGEWFELTNLAEQTLELGGCTVGNGSANVLLPAQGAGAGWIGVVARSTAAIDNGGVVAFAPFDFSLLSSGSLNLSCDGRLIDATSWSAETAGRARGIDPRRTTAALNDDEANWCLATAPYNASDFGSPGSANELCPTTGPVAPAPAAGEVLLNELMIDPVVLLDTSAEWVELRSVASAPRDLFGCVLNNGSTDSAPFPSIELLAGAFSLLGHSTDAVANGGLAIDGLFAFGLTNGSGTIALKCSGTVIDTVAWSSSTPARSLQRDPAAPTTLCTAPPAVGEYSTSNFGTPRALNAACP